HIEFSLASLLVFFRGKRGTEVIALQDEADFLEFYRNVWNRYEAGTATVRDVVTEFLGMEDHWEMNLNEIPNLTDELTAIVEDILSDGMETALKKVC
ncbi:tagaturonate reductase, partial [Turicibacter sanguinis]|nr:tagaturonate reductase [Turicibacter sanguinis]